MLALPPAFAAMAAFRQFMLYVLVPHQDKPGKMQKFPVSPYTGQVADAHNPANWTDAATAVHLAAQWGSSYGVAFVFTKADPFFFLDLDSHFDGRQWSPLAQRVGAMFPGAAMELSQSGTGMHIFGRAMPMLHASRNREAQMELYTSGRFVALTGNQAMGDAGTDHTAALAALIDWGFRPGAASNGDFELSDAPVPEWRGPTDDDDLLRRALAAKSVAAKLGNAATFKDLWEKNVDILAQAYPDPAGFNASDADAALASHLSFWTGRHGKRIERLMRRSALAREKYEREDYLPRTIAAICAKGGDVCQDRPIALPEHMVLNGSTLATDFALPTIAAPDPSVADMRSVAGSTFMSAEGARQLFKGCVYIKEEGKVYVPGCGRLKQDQFKVVFGGYTFAMDDINQRTSRNAWEAFTENQMLRPPMADGICFRPELPAGFIMQEAGRTRVNIYEPIEVRRVKGDPTPFLTHLQKVLPNERDRIIFLSYMAACVQHKGVKFQWAPLLQGVPGNGKTFFTRCVAEAVGRRYVHWPKASKLSKDFNGWMVGKLLYGVEDIYTAHGREEVIEELKPMITGGDGLEIEGKGVDQVSFDICGNFIFNSNHKDGVRKTRDDRRFALFFSAQQDVADLARDGMNGRYMPDLYDWAKADGYAIVAELLHTYPIPDEFNPATTCHRAPMTSSTEAAIRSSLGGIEQHVQEAIAQGLPGFAGGWVSSIMLGRLLEDIRQSQRLTPNKRRDMLRHLGYRIHPGLPDGRVNNSVQPDAGKPQLFILEGHPSAFLRDGSEIARAYTAAQKQ